MSICRNEVLSEESQLIKEVGIFWAGIFWWKFSGGSFPEESLMGENFPSGIFTRGISPEPFEIDSDNTL